MDRKKIFAGLLKYSGALIALRRFSNKGVLRILMYHRIVNNKESVPYYLGGISPDIFESQMKFLSENFSVITLEEAYGRIASGKSVPRNAVAITIDDGYRDCYINAYPILRKYSISATVYLTTGNIASQNPFWVDKIGYFFKNGNPANTVYEHPVLSRIPVDSREKRIAVLGTIIEKLKTVSEKVKCEVVADLKDFFQVSDKELDVDYNLSWPQIKEMGNNGIFFGAHTVTHPILTRVPLETAEKEIAESAKMITENTGRPVIGFCYPNGGVSDFNDSIINILKNKGFKYAVTTIWGSNNANANLFALKRMEPNFNNDLVNFECLLSGGFSLAGKLRDIFRG